MSELLEQVKQNNPQLEQARQVHKAAQASVPQATAWSNPMVGLIQQPIPSSPLRLGASQGFSYTLTQPFQLFGKKRLAGEIAQDQADAVGTQVVATEQQLAAQVKSTFYQLLAYQHQERISQDNLQRLEQIKRISKVRYANNAAAYVDYLNAQVAQSSAQNDLFALQRQIDTTRQSLNILVGRDPHIPLEISGTIPALSSQMASLDEFATLTLKHNPTLQGTALQVSAAEKGVEYAKKAYLPDFQVIMTKISDNPPWGLSGQSYGVELDLVLPTWFLEKERAGEDQARANLLANRAGDMSARQQILLGVASAYNTVLQARKQMEFIRDRQLPEAQTAWRLAMQNYATNNSQAFADLLLAQTNLRTTELSLLQAESAAAQAWASLEAAVGTELKL
ncbi:MAG: TolC family protein [Betaproteobacteria bacterium]|nr:TolC family protein [Betaproteobacteria bacterium]